jgi:hypothetical protein
MPDGFLLLIESVIGRRSMAVDGKWRPGVSSIRPLRIVRGVDHARDSGVCQPGIARDVEF